MRGTAPRRRAGTAKRRAVAPIEGPLYTALERARRRARSTHVVEWAGAQVASVKRAFGEAAANAGLDGVTPSSGVAPPGDRPRTEAWRSAGGAGDGGREGTVMQANVNTPPANLVYLNHV
jgi:hypothetical protein